MKKININRIIKHQSFQTLIILIFNILLNLILNVVLTRSLNAKGFGIYAYGTTLLATLSIFSTLGFNELLIRDTAIYVQKKSWGLLHGIINFSHKLVFLFSILISLLIAFLLIRIETPLRSSRLICITIALLLPFLSIKNLQVSVLQGLKKTPLSLLPEKIIQPFLLLLLILILSFFSVSSSIFIIIIFYGITSIISLLISKINLSANLPLSTFLSPKEFQCKSWLQASIPLMLINGVNLLLNQIDIFMLGYMKQSEDVGIYVIANKISTLIAFLLVANNLVLRPKIAENFASGNIKQMKKIFFRNSLSVFLLSLPIVLSVIMFSREILSLFGEEFIAGSSILSVLCFGQVVNVLAGPVNLTLNMTNHHHFSLVSMIFSLIVNAIANYLLIPSWGGLGAALATTFTLSTWNLISFLFVKNKVFK